MSVQKLNQNNFNNAIANGTALVDFYADWCGPCRIVSPIVDEIAEERRHISKTSSGNLSIYIFVLFLFRAFF